MAQTLGVKGMRKLVKMAAAAAVASAAFVPVQASAQNVTFSGSVPHRCVIVISDGDGVLVTSADGTTMSSRLAGGDPGDATVTATNGSFTLSSSVTTGNGDTPDTESGEMDILTNNTASATTSQALTNSGANDVDVHYVSTKAAGFTVGVYNPVVTLTCS